MNIMSKGEKIFTKNFIGTIVEELDNNMFGVDFVHRKENERNYNVVSAKLIEDMIAQKEWFVDYDPFYRGNHE